MSRSLSELPRIERILVAWCLVPLAAVPWVVLESMQRGRFPAIAAVLSVPWFAGALGLAWRADRRRSAEKEKSP